MLVIIKTLVNFYDKNSNNTFIKKIKKTQIIPILVNFLHCDMKIGLFIQFCHNYDPLFYSIKTMMIFFFSDMGIKKMRISV